MPVNLFSFVDLHRRAVVTATHLLGKGVEHAAAQGVSEADLLDWRLIEDMQPLRFQLAVICNFARQWPARVAGLPEPAEVSDQMDIAGFQAALADALAYVGALTPAQFEGRDEVPLEFAIGPGMKPTLPAGQWLSVFAITNLHFHLSTAYGILRSKGVQIGKPDMFAAGL